MIVEFTSAAKTEYIQAIDNYNIQLPGLGYEFAAAIEQAVSKIVQHPQAWTPYGKYTRRCIVSRFPYGILYLQEDDKIIIVAVKHLRTNPRSWRSIVEKIEGQ